MTDIAKDHESLDQVYGRIKDVLTQARSRAWQTINAAMVTSYWEVGRIIIEEEQRGKARAEYGTQLLKSLSERLSTEFGKGFDRTNLQNMRAFYLAYPIVDALRPQLTWTHYRREFIMRTVFPRMLVIRKLMKKAMCRICTYCN